MNTTAPLNDDEYDQLDELLAALGPQTLDVAGVEGLLTALVVGPAAAEPAPAAWLPLVWSGAAATDDAKATAETITAETITADATAQALILRHHAYMREWMRKDPASFEPIYDCGGSWTAAAWCAGFLAGVRLSHEAWAPLRASQPGLLAPFQPPANAARVAPAVVQINAFFHAPAAKTVKPGRNDPCPCGSGQKYKKCCGA